MNVTTEQTGTAEEQTARRLILHDTHLAHGASMTEHDGFLLPASYGDTSGEYAAVREEGAGLFDLSARGRIEVAGTEAVQFLNGLITNDVKALEEGAWMLAAFPNVQGRLIGFARVLRIDAQTFLFDTEAATHDAILQALMRFTLAGDFRVTDKSASITTLSVQGKRAPTIVGKVFGEPAASVAHNRIATIDHNGARSRIIHQTHTAEDGFDILIEAAGAAARYEELVHAGARPVGFDALEILRIEAGIGRYGVDFDSTNVVLEAGLDEAVSYTKGCYVGQEIIARIHWRGHVARRLTGLEFDTAYTIADIKPGAKLLAAADGKEAGKITSVTHSPALNCPVALALVRYAYLAPGTELQPVNEANAAAIEGHICELPFVRGGWYEVSEEDPATKTEANAEQG